MCKKILKDVYRQNKSLVSYKYLDVVSELLKYKICNNGEQAKIVIGSFCDEIGLTWKFTTPEKVKEDEDRIRAIRIRIEEKVNQLKAGKKELESSLDRIGKVMKTLLLDIDSEINKMSSAIKTLKSSSEAIYKEEDNLKVLGQQVADLQKLRRKIEEVKSSCNETQKNIAKEVENAEQKEITLDNVQVILNEVTTKEGVINKLFNEFIGKYNNEIIKVVQDGFRNAKSRFYNTESEINAEREQIKDKISKEKKQLTKPITRNFVLSQVGLLIVFFFIYVPFISQSTANLEKSALKFFCLNSIGLVCYIYLVIKQFNKYNQMQFELLKEKEDYRSDGNLISSIIFACISFAFFQFILLFVTNLYGTSLQESILQFYIGLIKFAIIAIIVILFLLYQYGKNE